MSTNNFKWSNVLIVVPDFELEGEDGEIVDFNKFAYDEYVGDVQNQLEKIGFDVCDKWDNDNNYNGKIIARYGMEDTNPHDNMIVWVEVVIRNGYYGGANIDYTIDGDFGIENEQNKKQVAHYEAMKRKLERLAIKTEKILRKNGTELTQLGTMSNGEAVYKLKK